MAICVSSYYFIDFQEIFSDNIIARPEQGSFYHPKAIKILHIPILTNMLEFSSEVFEGNS